MLPGKRNSTGAIYVLQGPPPAGTPFVGGIAVSQDGAIYVSQAFTPPFSPANLFASGEQGAWYDPSDLSTMFQDSAGTTPVTADGQPVGLILDKSGRNNHASQATAAKRPLYKTSGGLHWLQFDGVDDSLSTAAVDFTATDKMSVFGGLYFANNSGNQSIVALSAYPDGTAGSFRVDSNNATIRTQLGMMGGRKLSLAPQSAPITVVHTFAYDKASGGSIGARKNGAALALTVVVNDTVPAGGFGTLPINIGSQGETTSWFNGNIYSIIILGRLATTQEITDTEAWVAAKTGVVLP